MVRLVLPKGFEIILKYLKKIEICTFGSEGTIINILVLF